MGVEEMCGSWGALSRKDTFSCFYCEGHREGMLERYGWTVAGSSWFHCKEFFCQRTALCSHFWSLMRYMKPTGKKTKLKAREQVGLQRVGCYAMWIKPEERPIH